MIAWDSDFLARGGKEFSSWLICQLISLFADKNSCLSVWTACCHMSWCSIAFPTRRTKWFQVGGTSSSHVCNETIFQQDQSDSCCLAMLLRENRTWHPLMMQRNCIHALFCWTCWRFLKLLWCIMMQCGNFHHWHPREQQDTFTSPNNVSSHCKTLTSETTVQKQHTTQQCLTQPAFSCASDSHESLWRLSPAIQRGANLPLFEFFTFSFQTQLMVVLLRNSFQLITSDNMAQNFIQPRILILLFLLTNSSKSCFENSEWKIFILSNDQPCSCDLSQVCPKWTLKNSLSQLKLQGFF